LRRHADGVIAAGDERSRDQIMADTLVERLTGQVAAEDVSAEIGLVMSDAALFGGDEEPADLDGYGPVPAEVARDIARRASSGDKAETGSEKVDTDIDEADGGAGVPAAAADITGRDAGRARIWLRRLFTDPVTGIVVDVDPRRRRFDGVLARLLVYRDRTCRDPFCDAPIRHLDHIRPSAAGGSTTPSNGRGLCERGNYVREMPGWSIRLVDPDRHIVETTTPTGHRHRSRPPAAPGISARRRV
jgi:hypothetical protein